MRGVDCALNSPTTAENFVDMKKTAVHEAGHAIVAWLFGLALTRIYLDLETEGGGPSQKSILPSCASSSKLPSTTRALSQSIFSRAAQLPATAAQSTT